MYTDTGLLYRLAKELKDRHYINHNNGIFVNDKQIERIQDYIDDLVFEQFFSLNAFKPMLVPKSYSSYRYSNKGWIFVKDDFYLDLSDPFDRYTFVMIVSTPDFFESKFSNQGKCLFPLGFTIKRYGAVGHALVRHLGLYQNPVFELLENDLRSDNSSLSPLNRVEQLYLYKHLAKNRHFYDCYYCDFFELKYQFANIFNLPIFSNYTYGEVLSLYCILVEKLKLYETSLSSILALILPEDSSFSPSIINQFYNFELRINAIFDENMIDVRDLYLRFVSETNSRAFTFTESMHGGYVNIQLFDQETICAVNRDNTIPLPYYHSKCDKFKILI